MVSLNILQIGEKTKEWRGKKKIATGKMWQKVHKENMEKKDNMK